MNDKSSLVIFHDQTLLEEMCFLTTHTVHKQTHHLILVMMTRVVAMMAPIISPNIPAAIILGNLPSSSWQFYGKRHNNKTITSVLQYSQNCSHIQ